MPNSSGLAAQPSLRLRPSAGGWPQAMTMTGLLLAAILGLYWDTVAYLASIWNQVEEGEYGHGYLVVGITVYLIYRERHTLAALTPRPSGWGVAAMLGLSVLWLLGAVADVMVVQAAALVLMPLALVLAVQGWAVTRRLLLPLGFLLFAVPVWSLLSPMLQSFTQEVVYSAVRALGVPAMAREHVIVLPYGELAIEEACSGLRYLLAALTLGVLYAYLNYTSLGARLLVVALSAAGAILANLIRVFVVVYVGYTSDMQSPLVNDHLSLGWIIFGIVVFLLLFVDVVLSRRRTAKGEPAQTVVGARGSVPTAATRSAGTGRMGAAAAFALVAAALGPGVLSWTLAASTESTPARVALPSVTGEWEGPLSGQDDWVLVYGDATTARGMYERGADQIHVNVAYYPAQTQGRELINETNHLSNRDVWREIYPRGRPTTAAADTVVLEQLLRHRNGRTRVVWYWYEVGGRSTVSPWQAKLLQVWGALSGNTSAALVAVAMDYSDDPSSARDRLATFLGSSRAQLVAAVGRKDGRRNGA